MIFSSLLRLPNADVLGGEPQLSHLFREMKRPVPSVQELCPWGALNPGTNMSGKEPDCREDYSLLCGPFIWNETGKPEFQPFLQGFSSIIKYSLDKRELYLDYVSVYWTGFDNDWD